jgi:hypothetical protein
MNLNHWSWLGCSFDWCSWLLGWGYLSRRLRGFHFGNWLSDWGWLSSWSWLIGCTFLGCCLRLSGRLSFFSLLLFGGRGFGGWCLLFLFLLWG